MGFSRQNTRSLKGAIVLLLLDGPYVEIPAVDATPVGFLLLLTSAIPIVATEGISPEVRRITGRAYRHSVTGQTHGRSIIGTAKFPLRRTA